MLTLRFLEIYVWNEANCTNNFPYWGGWGGRLVGMKSWWSPLRKKKKCKKTRPAWLVKKLVLCRSGNANGMSKRHWFRDIPVSCLHKRLNFATVPFNGGHWKHYRVRPRPQKGSACRNSNLHFLKLSVACMHQSGRGPPWYGCISFFIPLPLLLLNHDRFHFKAT